ncbi:E3 ubiquitin-protein ligase TRIM37-like isoform X2 [Corticium candelabrum]|uniref:E3 ubiquitin-protein ligase TRIM37-like isoform X2 n=1 Tax=Corticium candelabrum TaxID=121492 RepID=UPI002E26D069|nr:E3 ubiquitin-protein ligase TRIM37-like isoform X2 [Corticium candelabrum]
MEAKTSVESLNEVFRCFICMEKPKDARICPHCSKLCCCSCIVRWLTEQRPSCPHCRAGLFMRDLVNLRWAEDVSHHLDSLQSQVCHLSPDRETKCRVHTDEKQNIYCSDCDACICHKCALFTGRDKNVCNVKEGREEAFQRMHQAWLMVCERLDTEFKERLQTLKESRSSLDKHKGAVEMLLLEIECQMKSLGRTELIRKSSSLRKRIQKVQGHDVNFANSSPISSDFPNEIMPSFERGGLQDTFRISDFRAACVSGKPVYSNSMVLYGIEWRLKVYPNGSEMVRDQYVSVFLELVTGPGDPSKYEYKIEMTHLQSGDPAMSVGRKFVSMFEVGECWGYNRFFRLECLESEGFLVNDSIEFQYSVRHASFFYLCRDMGWYVEQVESDRDRHRHRLELLQKDVPEVVDSCSMTSTDALAPVTVTDCPCDVESPASTMTSAQVELSDNACQPLAAVAAQSVAHERYPLSEQLNRPCEQDAEQMRAPDPKLRCSSGVAESESHSHSHFDQNSLPDDFATDYSPPVANGSSTTEEGLHSSHHQILNVSIDLDEWSGTGSHSGSDSDTDDQYDSPNLSSLPVYEVSDASDDVDLLQDDQEHSFAEGLSAYAAHHYSTDFVPTEVRSIAFPTQPFERSASPDAYDNPPGLQSSIAAALSRCRDGRPMTPPFQRVPMFTWRRQRRPDNQWMPPSDENDAPSVDNQRSMSLQNCYVHIPPTNHDIVDSEMCNYDSATQ